MARTLEEQETIARFDRSDSPASLYTASQSQARKWVRLGYTVTPQGTGFIARVPKSCISFRRLKGSGAVAGTSIEKPRKGSGVLKRKGHPGNNPQSVTH